MYIGTVVCNGVYMIVKYCDAMGEVFWCVRVQQGANFDTQT